MTDGKFLILSLPHSTDGMLFFFSEHGRDYTPLLCSADRYTREEVMTQEHWLNDGTHTLAVPVDEALFRCRSVVPTSEMDAMRQRALPRAAERAA